ncbi:MAG: alanine dehydrogenase, partial [Alphaproteobacteria bacterium]|nr:alanine dehydrogenase [Alphaproteobacteria bacterium]
VRPAKVTIIGGGVSGLNAARMAVGMEADVTILEKNQSRMRFLDNIFAGRAVIEYASLDSIEERVTDSDLVIGAVLIPGAAAPRLVTRAMLGRMHKGTVLVDISIDQGGCFETSKPTTHQNPTFIVDNVVHYCVANMPGSVPLTSALALNQAVLPYALALADKGWKAALLDDPHLRAGLNVLHGEITHAQVAGALGLPFAAEPKAFAA